MHYKYTTGLQGEGFHRLVGAIEAEIGGWSKPNGRPRALTLAQATHVTLIYYRSNISQLFLGEIFGVDQSTINRYIILLEKIIDRVLKRYVPRRISLAIKGLVTLIDGTLLPCWAYKTHPKLYSGKHRKTGHVVQVFCGLDGKILYISSPLPGCTHDAKAFKDSKYKRMLNKTNAIGDRGYQGTGILTPIKTPPGGELIENQKAFNKQIHSLRAANERGIAHVKNMKILATGYRRPLSAWMQTYRTARALIFFIQTFA